MNIDLPLVEKPEGMRLMHVVLFWFDEDNQNWKTEMQAVESDPVDAATQASSLRGLADTIELESEFREVIDSTCAECGHPWDEHGSYGCVVPVRESMICYCMLPRP